MILPPDKDELEDTTEAAISLLTEASRSTDALEEEGEGVLLGIWVQGMREVSAGKETEGMKILFPLTEFLVVEAAGGSCCDTRVTLCWGLPAVINPRPPWLYG